MYECAVHGFLVIAEKLVGTKTWSKIAHWELTCQKLFDILHFFVTYF